MQRLLHLLGLVVALGSCVGPEGGAPRIHDIQGAGHISPYDGAWVEGVLGRVSARTPTGFYVEDPRPDDNPATSEALFVYLGAPPSVSPGEAVRVAGAVEEHRPSHRGADLTSTELRASAVEPLRDDALPRLSPTLIGEAGRRPPKARIDADATVFAPERDGLDFYESLEGMWVRVEGARVVGPTNAYDEAWVVGDEGRALSSPRAPFGLLSSAEDESPERIKLSGALTPEGLPPLDVGDGLGAVEGILAYDFGAPALFVFAAPTRRTPPRQPGTLGTAGASGAPGALSVASYNVQNLDPKVESRSLVADARDVDDDLGDGRFAKIGADIALGLGAPDIVVLVEVQDGDGAEDTGRTDAVATYTRLTEAIREAGGPSYAFVDVAPVDGEDGGQPGGNIRVGFLYKPARASLAPSRYGPGAAGVPLRLIDEPGGPALSHNPGRLALEGAASVGTREPVVAHFLVGDQALFVVGAHFASRFGSEPAFGAHQPPLVAGGATRIAQAKRVADFTSALLRASPSALVLVAGDLNDGPTGPSLAPLTAVGLVDLVAELPPDVPRSTYVFDGCGEAIDHILVASAWAARATLELLPVNADFSSSPDRPPRASDHDPLRLSIALGP